MCGGRRRKFSKIEMSVGHYLRMTPDVHTESPFQTSRVSAVHDRGLRVHIPSDDKRRHRILNGVGTLEFFPSPGKACRGIYSSTRGCFFEADIVETSADSLDATKYLFSTDRRLEGLKDLVQQAKFLCHIVTRAYGVADTTRSVSHVPFTGTPTPRGGSVVPLLVCLC